MEPFIIYPAIDLRSGQVVRLQQGDPQRQTTYSADPASVTERWLQAGAPWLHVVNLDGAFGEQDSANRKAIETVLGAASANGTQVQVGGGLRSLADVGEVLRLGASRAVLGTLAVERPDVLQECLRRFGPERVAVGIDALHGQVRVRGWTEQAGVTAVELGGRMAQAGLTWLVFTDVSRDGLGQGLNVAAALELARASRLNVIASGGVNDASDILRAHQAGLSGVIVGKALYDGRLEIKDWILENLSQ
jgi:phosphoribosylformimino-5-aminoimidazole carboxamide ribotide isomerase